MQLKIDPSDSEKLCPDCNQVKSIWAFALSTNSDDMCFPICKECASKRYRAQIKNYYRYFPSRKNKGLADFVRQKCHDSVLRGKIHG